MKTNRDISISFIRFFAMASIVISHMMQYYEYPLYKWFNIGVQIFLCISGYLYGFREFKVKIADFYKKQFIKILMDYYIVVIPVMLLQFTFKRGEISWIQAVTCLFTNGRINGGEHLWYIPYILYCYLWIPAMIYLFDKVSVSKVRTHLRLVGLMSLMVLLSITFIPYFNSAWVNCFIIGLFIGRCQFNQINLKVTKGIICLSAIAMNSLQIYLVYVKEIIFTGAKLKLFEMFCDYAHVALGCSIFILIQAVYQGVLKGRKQIKFVGYVLKLSDKYSYDIYLTHQFFILGSFSLMMFTTNKTVNILIILLLVIITSIIVNAISKMLRRKIEL